MSTPIVLSASDWIVISGEFKRPWIQSVASADADFHLQNELKLTMRTATARWGLPQHVARKILKEARFQHKSDTKSTEQTTESSDSDTSLTQIQRESGAELPESHTNEPSGADLVQNVQTKHESSTVLTQIQHKSDTKSTEQAEQSPNSDTVLTQIQHKNTTVPTQTERNPTPLPESHTNQLDLVRNVRIQTMTKRDKKLTPKESRELRRSARLKSIMNARKDVLISVDRIGKIGQNGGEGGKGGRSAEQVGEDRSLQLGSSTVMEPTLDLLSEMKLIQSDRRSEHASGLRETDPMSSKIIDSPNSKEINGDSNSKEKTDPEITSDQKAQWTSLIRSWISESKTSRSTRLQQINLIGLDQIADGLHGLKCEIAPLSAARSKVTPTKTLAMQALSQWARLGYMGWTEYAEDARLIIRAARECPYSLFAHDIRSFAGNRMTRASTLFRGDRWSVRLEESYRWRSEGYPDGSESSGVDTMWADYIAGIASGGLQYSDDPERSRLIGKIARLAGKSLSSEWKSAFGRVAQDRVMDRFKLAARRIL